MSLIEHKHPDIEGDWKPTKGGGMVQGKSLSCPSAPKEVGGRISFTGREDSKGSPGGVLYWEPIAHEHPFPLVNQRDHSDGKERPPPRNAC